MKTLVEVNASGLLHPVKYPALKCSSLVGVLCSTKVRAKYNEIVSILKRLGYSEDEIYLGRQISAARAVLAGIKDLQNNAVLNKIDRIFLDDANRNYERVSVQLKDMLKREDNSLLISIKEFRQTVFPLEIEVSPDGGDPDKQNKTLADVLPSLRVHVEAKLDEIIEENRKLDLERENIERSKKQAIQNFEHVVHNIQKPYPGPLTLDKHDALKGLIDYCEKIVSLKITENIFKTLNLYTKMF